MHASCTAAADTAEPGIREEEIGSVNNAIQDTDAFCSLLCRLDILILLTGKRSG